MPDSRPVVHLELHTSDLGGAQSLYGELFGWRPEHLHTPHGDYVAVEMGRRLGGGMVECGTGHALWLPYVEVTDAAEATARARELGARVRLEPREGPAGWRAVVTSRAGGDIAFWQPKGR
jgi:predicted enzyme related to lactoylglutathione lyase